MLYIFFIIVLKAEGLIKRSFFCKTRKDNQQVIIYLFHIALPDPFAVVTVDGEQTHTTLSDKGTLGPFWNNMCRFVVFETSVLSIQVFDQKKFKKDGQGFLGVATFVVSAAIDLRYPQSSKKL